MSETVEQPTPKMRRQLPMGSDPHSVRQRIEAMEKLLRHDWPGNLREMSHTVRTMALFCNSSVILPEHVVFPSDLSPGRAPAGSETPERLQAGNHQESDAEADLSLERAMRKHVRFVYDHANRNQRRAARLLGISRSTLSRYLREPAQK